MQVVVCYGIPLPQKNREKDYEDDEYGETVVTEEEEELDEDDVKKIVGFFQFHYNGYRGRWENEGDFEERV